MDKELILKRLGQKIREIRKEKGMSQKDLAHAVNKDQQSVQRLESGNVNPSYYYLTEIAVGLGVEVKDLIL
ncbi:transcriptional regulator with XRE-family HTH domain [Pedobacter cryoconitis]|uniref:helix-turn-helix domain-containing protein n=1 Tax=Pedobacter cryoconitis TaxID=188932 RepID=UPI00161DFA44|nr:helix-turn-helix transcriptional regulator [Pedobacter cryoconitis]MBB6273142.1 transcriptional regulator with XRE-family HTH domain [Pedobacter cryoconitis]